MQTSIMRLSLPCSGMARLFCRVAIAKVIIIFKSHAMVERTNPNAINNKQRFLNEMPRLINTMN